MTTPVQRAARFTLAFALVSFHVATVHADDAAAIQPDIVYGHKDGLALTMDYFRPTGQPNGAAVLFMVSGGWHSRWAPPEQARGRFVALLDEGFHVFAVRHGSSPRYVIPEIVEDVRRGVRFVRSRADQWGIDPDRIGVFGGSAGGHLSLMLGLTSDSGDPDAKEPVLRHSNRVAAVVAYFPPSDIREFVDEASPYYHNYPALQFEAARAGEFSPLLHASEDDPPTLMIHGDKDLLVPIKHSEQMREALTNVGVTSELLVIEGAAHGFRGDDNTRAEAALVSWFKKHLAEPK